uniref:WW domain-containing protein n=1 Tax=Heterorhabditis bacteriophora TaxID=37862 RepID=A0A1I7XHJ2_HETBA
MYWFLRLESNGESGQLSSVGFMAITISLTSFQISTVPLANVERSGKERREVSLAESLDELSSLSQRVRIPTFNWWNYVYEYNDSGEQTVQTCHPPSISTVKTKAYGIYSQSY